MEIMNNDILLEEIFCLQYEMKALSDITLRKESERWIPGFLYKVTEEEHLDRYNFISKYVKDKNVLDIACGSGFGSYTMATTGEAKKVIGVDLDKDAIRYANHKFQNEKIKRFAEDAVKFRYSEKFDCAVSFETIEHIPNYLDFINNLYNNLKVDGQLIISTPIRATTTDKPINPYHVIEWSFQDFLKLLEPLFLVEKIFVQNISLHTEYYAKRTLLQRIKDKLRGIPPKMNSKIEYHNGIFEDYSKFDMSKIETGYVICVCKKK